MVPSRDGEEPPKVYRVALKKVAELEPSYVRPSIALTLIFLIYNG